MAIYTWPTDVRIGTAEYSLEYDVQINVMRNGSITTYGLPGARWTCTITFEDDIEGGQRPRVEALIMRLEGGTNRLQMQYWPRQAPNGTMRGAPTVNNNASAGAKQIVLTNVNGTLKRGDLLGILGQLVMVMTDTSPSGGVMTVDFVPPLRAAANVGTAVTWDRPSIKWIPKSSIAGPFPYRQSGVRPGFAVEFVEAY